MGSSGLGSGHESLHSAVKRPRFCCELFEGCVLIILISMYQIVTTTPIIVVSAYFGSLQPLFQNLPLGRSPCIDTIVLMPSTAGLLIPKRNRLVDPTKLSYKISKINPHLSQEYVVYVHVPTCSDIARHLLT